MLTPGQIKKVRIIEGFGIHDEDPFFRTFPPGIGYSSFGSSSNSISNFEQKRSVVGEAPVAEDGSFYVEVPSDTVLHWQTVDEQGMALQDALTWAWVRPGEHRVCLGCHEQRTTIPDLTAVPLAAKSAPINLNTPVEQRQTIDFRRDLTPIIEARCAGCHNEDQLAGGLDLSEGDQLVYQRMAHRTDGSSPFRAAVFNKAYLNLSTEATGRLGKFIHPGFAQNLRWCGGCLGTACCTMRRSISVRPARRSVTKARKVRIVGRPGRSMGQSVGAGRISQLRCEAQP